MSKVAATMSHSASWKSAASSGESAPDADLTKTLAKRFKVSEDAMRYRLTNLGVIRP